MLCRGKDFLIQTDDEQYSHLINAISVWVATKDRCYITLTPVVTQVAYQLSPFKS